MGPGSAGVRMSEVPAAARRLYAVTHPEATHHVDSLVDG